jgi:hypothetical protein
MTFLTMFLPTWTCITAMCGSITTKAIIGLGHIVVLFFSLGASLVATYCFKSRVILKSWPKVRVYLLSNNC